ncbi:carbohydrate kinase family protein [Halomarina oriensis]|uniref:Carbohydrate kinase family protein n=1 Tax=Halomarina oriensis TaxID=671145 RepID=A0A6B0GGD0_9EURY|nr:carbohydrate kinase family protein [Halomarina oriensis]MWG33067.1 carbohydrate kinase family protein [Halomarina oriensis]
MRVLCAGHVNWDVTLRVDRLPEPDGEVSVEQRVQAGGGSAANVACTLASLDATVSLFGSVGDDEEGSLARNELDAFGVDTDHVVVVPGHETTTKYLVVDGSGEVMVLSNTGANEAFTPDDIDPAVLERVDHLHLTSQQPATAAVLAELAAESGVSVSFDPGRRIANRDYGGTLAHVDVLFLNEREARVLERAASFDSLVAEATVVKHGGRGATVHTEDGTVDHDGYPLEALDTTGAGDAFAAGFLAARSGGYERALSVANACGAMAALNVGARTTPTRDEVEAFLADHC